jgi:poly(A) polymerase
VVDPLGGLADLRAGRVRFVGEPAARIEEDYLRILRFFRIHAWYGDPAGGLDPDGLAACAALQEGIGRLSRERVGAETTKLLAAPDPAPAVAAMAAAGILARVLPGADATTLAPLVHAEAAAGAAPRWQRRLAALGWRPEWTAALRLSRADGRALDAIAAALAAGDPPAAAAWRLGPDAARDAALVRAAGLGSPPPADLEAEITRGAAAVFPLSAADVGLEGPALGRALKRLETAWLASDFRLDAKALLALR